MKPSLFVCLAALVALSACSSEKPQDPETRDRVQAFKSVLNAFEPLGLMVREKQPFDPIRFAELAAQLKDESRKPFAHFAAAPTGSSKARPEIWSEPARFAKARDTFYQHADQLAAVTAGKPALKLADVSPAYGQLAQSCKSCHDAFRRTVTE